MASERIDHVTEAWYLLERARVGSREDVTVQAAQVHATLAVVEQLRIANLIALGSMRVRPDEVPIFRHLVMEPVNEFDVRPTAAIREGLGL